MPRTAPTDAERLCKLRVRLAKGEKIQTLRDIGEAALELQLVAPEALQESIGKFIDRAEMKIRALGGTWKRPAQIDDETDEEQHPISIEGGDLLLAKLRAVHGRNRADIPPALMPP